MEHTFRAETEVVEITQPSLGALVNVDLCLACLDGEHENICFDNQVSLGLVKCLCPCHPSILES